MSLYDLADSLSKDLGPAYHARPDYDFVIPSRDGVSVARADAAIFASAVPSIHTAAVGFHASRNGSAASALEQFAYLGAPLLVTETDGSLALYKYSGSVAEKVDERKPPDTQWIREHVLEDMDYGQLRLPLATTRALLIRDTRDALYKSISALVQQAQEERHLTPAESFKVAMAAIRQLILPDFGAAIAMPRLLAQYAKGLAAQAVGRISFANLPAESIAELYERFAVSKIARQRHGVVYTPAWLARYVVDRLPPEAFTAGCTLDPTCGSGTFLVCALERVVERAKRDGRSIDTELLQRSICGMDIDPVAVEAARLSLDMFASAMGVSGVTWNLSAADATAEVVMAEWLVGNLPFGYRTYQERDISSVILEHIHKTNHSLRALSLIVPDSLAYTGSARSTRAVLRSHYDIQEVTRLPERVFGSSTAVTMVMTARKGTPEKSVLVREVRERDLASFRAGAFLSSSFYADFPAKPKDPWSFSPFSNDFAQASLRALTLAEVASVRVGLQTYGVDPQRVLGAPSTPPHRPLLDEPQTFARWSQTSIDTLPSLKAEREEVRRAGPWDKFENTKVIVRSTTDVEAADRLAAVPDAQGVWFTDKFVGVWPTGTLPVQAIAAYFQTRFARAWYQTNNPSRKLRVRVLTSLPIPKLSPSSWARVADLAPLDRVVRPPSTARGEAILEFNVNGEQSDEWEWFNSSVESALGLDPVSGSRLEEWLARKRGSANSARE